MQESWNQFFEEQLRLLRQQRSARVRGGLHHEVAEVGNNYLNFGSNDYLGLRQHPSLRDALLRSTERLGWGSGASPVLGGYTAEHRELERALAGLCNAQDCLVFSSGYACNVGVISCLLDDDSLVLSDQLNHASLIDGMRVGRSKKQVYRHCDLEDLSQKLDENRKDFRRCLIVTESVFSMDGDEAPLSELVAIANTYECGLIVDEAHAVGVFGSDGGGLIEELNLSDCVLIKLGTLSKAIGGIGGYAASTKNTIDFLVSRCRSYLFSTAPPPGAMAANRIAVELCRRMQDQRAHLLDLAKFTRQRLSELGWQVASGRSPIIPIIVGSPQVALDLSTRLAQAGILVPAIRPPTVPRDTCRLRISLSALHSKSDIEELCLALGNSKI